MKLERSTIPVLVALACLSCKSGGGAADDAERMSFDVRNDYEIQVPAGAREVRAWLALPDDREELQEVRDLSIELTSPPGSDVVHREVRDADGNRFLYVEARDAAAGEIAVTTSFELVRREARATTDPAATRPMTAAEAREMAPYLEGSTHVLVTPEIRAAAQGAVGDETNPLLQARLLYDWVLEHAQYWVKEPARWKASPVGSSAYCFDEGTGNCTDFHSLYAAGALSVGLPVQMVYGSFLKGPLDGVDADQSYHCWIEVHAPEVGWVPLDVAVADLYVDDFVYGDDNREKVSLTLADGYPGPDPAMVDYYFGRLDARRVTWHRGRDLALDPPPRSGPVNALPKAYVEVDGVPSSDYTRKLTFRELP